MGLNFTAENDYMYFYNFFTKRRTYWEKNIILCHIERKKTSVKVKIVYFKTGILEGFLDDFENKCQRGVPKM